MNGLTISKNAPPAFHILAKPTGAVCNLDCKYCFFLSKEALYPGSRFRMSDEMLESYLRQLFESHRAPEVTLAWQGGEPTLMGVDFYRRAIEIAERHRRPGMQFLHTMQTNGTLLDDEWAAFFKEHNFLIGISIDGPRDVHDAHRVDKGGIGTFDKVMRVLRMLQKHGVEYNILETVHRLTADQPKEVYRFLRDEARAEWVQFIPVIERVNPDGYNIYNVGNTVTNRSVRPEQFGRFLSVIFDEWVRHDVGRIYVQTIEAAVRNWLRMPTSGMCVFEETCGLGLALEHNGDLYSCDHFVEPGYLLGNIMETHMVEMVASEKQRKFGRDKRDALPRACRQCDVLLACRGECPKNRFLTTQDGEAGLNYLCAGLQAFFRRANEPMQIIATLMRLGRPASDVMAIMAGKEAEWQNKLTRGRPKDPCPCGSGLMFGQCHGWKRTGHGQRGRAKPVQHLRPRDNAGASW